MFNKGFKKGIVKLFFGSCLAVICLLTSTFSSMFPPSSALNAALGVGMFVGYLLVFLGILEFSTKNLDYTIAIISAAVMSLGGVISIFQSAEGRLGKLATTVTLHMRTVDILLVAFLLFAMIQDAINTNRRDLIPPFQFCSSAYIISGVLSSFLPTVAGLPLAGAIFGGTILLFSLIAHVYYLFTLNRLRRGKKLVSLKTLSEKREEAKAAKNKEAEEAAAAEAQPGVVPPKDEFKPTLAARIQADNEDARRLAAEARGETVEDIAALEAAGVADAADAADAAGEASEAAEAVEEAADAADTENAR